MEMWRRSEIRNWVPEVHKDPEVNKDPGVHKELEVAELVEDQSVKTFVMFRGSISPAVVKSPPLSFGTVPLLTPAAM